MSAIAGQNTGKNLEVLEHEGKTFVKIYNDTGGALANGAVYVLDYSVDADSVGAHYTLRAANTLAVPRYIAVVNNSPLGKSTIADQAWGFVQIAGYCSLVATSGTVTAEDTLEVINAGAAAIRDTVASGGKIVMTVGSFGKAVANVGTNQWSAILFGIPVQVAAT